MIEENERKFTTTFAPIRFADNVQTVLIQSAQGTIWAQPNGGALHTWPGTVVRWICAEPFSVSFRQQGGPPQPLSSLVSAKAANGMQQCEIEPKSFSGDFGPYYEYTITVGELTLDPIVIVDKKPK
jgi:hypothetical protein